MKKTSQQPKVIINEEMLLNELRSEHKQKGRDFLFNSSVIAKKLNGSVYVVRDLLPHLEEKKLVETTEFSRGKIVWRTKFGGKE